MLLLWRLKLSVLGVTLSLSLATLAFAGEPEAISNDDCMACHDSMAGSEFHSSVHASQLCTSCHKDITEIPHADKPLAVDCGSCHGREASVYLSSVHGKARQKGSLTAALCQDCHGSHDIYSVTKPKSKMHRSQVPSTCGKCHENILKVYSLSVHGKAALSGKAEAPICTDCHGEHSIKSHLDPDSKVYTATLSEKTCGQCHAAEKIFSKYGLPGDRLKTYMESYHGLASRFGVTTVANCSSCHGAHDILPSSDPKSSVNKINLRQTCGKCHPNVGDQLAKGSVHLSPSWKKDVLVYLVSQFYIYLIALVIGFMLFHNALDYGRKLKRHIEIAKQRPGKLRFTVNERRQHAVLAFSFIALAYTGFALKHPTAWWATPLLWKPLGADLRSLLHRVAAVIFSGLALVHLFYLLFKRRGRVQLRMMLPIKKDWDEFISRKSPGSGHYNYTEKLEYWALIWGTFIMIFTGVILVFENIIMKYFPKWVLDVAVTVHFYEAVLATLAIVIWHGYFTIFDPSHYPMNLSMLNGREQRHDKKEEEK